MFTGFINIYKNIIERPKICKSVTMATRGSHHGALKNFSIFVTVVPVFFLCIFIQSKLNILKLIFMKEQLYFYISVKIEKFLKNNIENIEILSSAVIFSNDVNWRCCELPRNSFEYLFTHFRIMSINKFFYLKIGSYFTLRNTRLCITD